MHRIVQEVVKFVELKRSQRPQWLERTVRALIKAFPIENLAPVDTVLHLSNGLELLKDLPVDSERNTYELALRGKLGPALIATRGYASSEVRECYTRALELCHLLEKTPSFEIVWGTWANNYVRAELQSSDDLARQILERAETNGMRDRDGGFALEAHRSVGSTLFSLGALTDARTHFQRGIALYKPELHADHAFHYAADPGIVCHSYLTIVLLLLEGEAAGLQAGRQLSRLARQISHPFSRVFASYWLASLHQLRRHVEKTIHHAEKVIGLSQEYRFPQWEGMGMILKGWAVAQQERDCRQAIQTIEQGLDKHESTGARIFRPYFLLLLAEAKKRAGNLSDAVRSVDEACNQAHKTKEGTWTAEICRLKGECALQQSEPSYHEAESLFRQAIEVASSQQSEVFRFRSVIQLCELLRKLRREEEAQALFEQTRRTIIKR